MHVFTQIIYSWRWLGLPTIKSRICSFSIFWSFWVTGPGFGTSLDMPIWKSSRFAHWKHISCLINIVQWIWTLSIGMQPQCSDVVLSLPLTPLPLPPFIHCSLYTQGIFIPIQTTNMRILNYILPRWWTYLSPWSLESSAFSALDKYLILFDHLMRPWVVCIWSHCVVDM
jgi:hypothetical protein